MKISLIGVGRLAGYQMQAISHTPGIHLIEAHDINSLRTEDLPGNVEFSTELDHLLQHSKADAFLISTPTPTHYDLALRIIEAGRIAVVEKPLALTVKQEVALRQAAATRKLPLYTVLHAAYGREVEWWVDQRAKRNFDLGSLRGFESSFLEPYYLDGQISPAAAGKAGAWLDYGMSSLSILARLIDPGAMALVDGRMTRISGLSCSEVQGLGVYRFLDNDCYGLGMVDCNWTLGRNSKITRLWYDNGLITLDHAREHAMLSCPRSKDLTFNLTTDKPRLVNHFCGVFTDLRDMYEQGIDNQGHSAVLHQLLFAATDQQR
jgi:D-galactose 1-dehydrogenase